MKIKINRPYSGIIHLRFSGQYELTSTFLRLQEFYESPLKGIKGKHFTLDHYMDLYAKEYGNFTYMIDWNGFNVPGDVIREFVKVFKDDLLPKEELLLSKIADEIASDDKFYLIGTWEDDAVLDHELAHAFYHLVPKYKREINKIIKKMEDNADAIYDRLKDMGYCKAVMKDELQAYLTTSDDEYLAEKFPKAVIGHACLLEMRERYKAEINNQ